MFNKHSLLSMKIEASYLYLIVFQLNCKLKQFLGDEKFLFAVHHAPSTPFILLYYFFHTFLYSVSPTLFSAALVTPNSSY